MSSAAPRDASFGAVDDVSLRAALDLSPGDDVDTSPAAAGDRRPGTAATLCRWCRSHIDDTRKRYCSKKCRQTAWRARRIDVVEDLGDTPKRLAYADPPYPGLSSKYYRDEPTFAGEVDHKRLLEQLATYDGWALSTSAKALREVLPLCPPEVRVCSWVKPHGASSKTRGIHNVWEPIIVLEARRRRPGVRDSLVALPARGGGTLPGRKPLAVCRWLFQLLGASRVDTLDDLFPGTGIVSKAFAQFKSIGSSLAVETL